MTTDTTVDVRRDAPAPAAPAGEWEPLAYARQRFDRLLNDFDWPDFRFPLGKRRTGVEASSPWTGLGLTAPAVDLIERPELYEVQAELPGLDPAQIEVKISDSMMTIRAEHHAEHEETSGAYHLRERSSGSFQRLFRLPNGIAADRVEARYDKGILKITLPKTAEAMEKERRIEVKPA